MGFDIRNASDPHLIGVCRIELAIQHIRCDGVLLAQCRRAGLPASAKRPPEVFRRAVSLLGVNSVIIAVSACVIVGVFASEGARPVVLIGCFAYYQKRLAILANLVRDCAA